MGSAGVASRGGGGRLAVGHAGVDMQSQGERVHGIGIRGGQGQRDDGGWWVAQLATREPLARVVGEAGGGSGCEVVS